MPPNGGSKMVAVESGDAVTEQMARHATSDPTLIVAGGRLADVRQSRSPTHYSNKGGGYGEIKTTFYFIQDTWYDALQTERLFKVMW